MPQYFDKLANRLDIVLVSEVIDKLGWNDLLSKMIIWEIFSGVNLYVVLLLNYK